MKKDPHLWLCTKLKSKWIKEKPEHKTNNTEPHRRESRSTLDLLKLRSFCLNDQRDTNQNSSEIPSYH